MTKTLTHPDYPAFLTELKSRILYARTSAARAVNRELVLLYWDIGRGIAEKQQKAGWGDSVVERLAADLRAEFPDMRGFSANNLWLIRQMYLEYSDAGFLEQLVQEIKKKGKQFLEQAVPESFASVGVDEIPAFLAQAVREIVASVPWGHHVLLLNWRTQSETRTAEHTTGPRIWKSGRR
jgi:predicted nuclease of restriction endonuclease-like (RecB) superfamily